MMPQRRLAPRRLLGYALIAAISLPVAALLVFAAYSPDSPIVDAGSKAAFARVINSCSPEEATSIKDQQKGDNFVAHRCRDGRFLLEVYRHDGRYAYVLTELNEATDLDGE